MADQGNVILTAPRSPQVTRKRKGGRGKERNSGAVWVKKPVLKKKKFCIDFKGQGGGRSGLGGKGSR